MATNSMDHLTWFRKQVESADVDLLREMVCTFPSTLMNAEADALCTASGRQSGSGESGRTMLGTTSP